MYSEQIKVCADVHMCHNYYQYIKPTLDQFLEDVKNDRPLITVVSGDYFDRRITADDHIYEIAMATLLEIAVHTKYLIVVQGTYSHDYNTLSILNTYNRIQKNIIFTKDITELELDGYKILCIPEAYPKDPNAYYEPFFQKKYDFVFGHGDIEGAVLHAGIDNTKLNGFKFSPVSLSKMAKFVVFGHIHKHQFLKENVCYPGSLGRWKYGEEEDKGYIEINLKMGMMRFKKLDAYRFETVVVKTEEDLLRLKEELKNNAITDNNFKIKISEELKDLKKGFLDEEFLKELNNEYKFEYLKEDFDDSDSLIYGEISKLSVGDQYLRMYEFEKENKKIPLKKVNSFFSPEKFKESVQVVLHEVSNEGKEEA